MLHAMWKTVSYFIALYRESTVLNTFAIPYQLTKHKFTLVRKILVVDNIDTITQHRDGPSAAAALTHTSWWDHTQADRTLKLQLCTYSDIVKSLIEAHQNSTVNQNCNLSCLHSMSMQYEILHMVSSVASDGLEPTWLQAI